MTDTRATDGHEGHAHHHDHGAHVGHHHQRVSDAGKVKDPVCGMMVDPHTTKHRAQYGQPYYFCSSGCRTKFMAEPAKYLDPASAAEG